MKWDAFITILAPYPAYDLSRPVSLQAILSDRIELAGKGFHNLPHIRTRERCNGAVHCPLEISLNAGTNVIYPLVLAWVDGVRGLQGTAKVQLLQARIVCERRFGIKLGLPLIPKCIFR